MGGDHEYRYLPFLPLWWPEIDPETGKAKADEDSVSEVEARDESEGLGPTSKEPSARVEFEQVPLKENDNKDASTASKLL